MSLQSILTLYLLLFNLKGVLGLCDLPGKGFVGVLGRWEWVGVSCGVYWRGGLGLKQWGEVGLIFGGYMEGCRDGYEVGFVCTMAEIGCNWARIGPSKSSQSLSIAHKWAVVID
ncbi:hypothetical protein Tco_0572422 [Tanacetum coccineum]